MKYNKYFSYLRALLILAFVYAWTMQAQHSTRLYRGSIQHGLNLGKLCLSSPLSFFITVNSLLLSSANILCHFLETITKSLCVCVWGGGEIGYMPVCVNEQSFWLTCSSLSFSSVNALKVPTSSLALLHCDSSLTHLKIQLWRRKGRREVWGVVARRGEWKTYFLLTSPLSQHPYQLLNTQSNHHNHTAV